MAGIRNLKDLRTWAGAEWADASDEDIMAMYSRVHKIDPVQVANTLGYDPGKGSLTRERLSSSVDQYQANLYDTGRAVASGLGLRGVADWMDEGRRQNQFQADVAGSRARELGGVDQWKDVHSVGDFANYAGGLAAQSLPYLGEAAVGGLAARGLMTGTRAAASAARELGMPATVQAARLGRASTVGAVAASYPSAVGDILNNQREQAGVTDDASAFIGGVPYAALNAFEPGTMAAAKMQAFRAPSAFLDGVSGWRGAAARLGYTAAVTGAKEGAAETGQEVINQWGRTQVDPSASMTSPDALDRYKESFIGGAVLGGAMSGVGGWRRSAAWQQKQEDDARLAQYQEELRRIAADRSQHLPKDLLAGVDNNGYIGGPFSVMPQPNITPPEQLVQRYGELTDQLNGVENFMQQWQIQWDAVQNVNTPEADAVRSQLMKQRAQLWEAGLNASVELESIEPLVQRHMAEQATGGQQTLDLFRSNEQLFGGGLGLSDIERVSVGPQLSPDFVDRSLGIRFPGDTSSRQADVEAALGAPTEHFAIDGGTGTEQRLDAGQYAAVAAGQAGDMPANDLTVEHAKNVRAQAPAYLQQGGRRKIVGRVVGDGNASGIVTRLRDEWAKATQNPEQAELADNLATWYKALTGNDIAAAPAAQNVSVSDVPGQRTGDSSVPGGANAQGSVDAAGRVSAPAVGANQPAGGVAANPGPAKPVTSGAKPGAASAVTTAVVGGSIDFELMDAAVPDPRLRKAIRLVLGVDAQGNRQDPRSLQAAADEAGIGANSHAAVSKELKRLGITKEVRNRFLASDAQATEQTDDPDTYDAREDSSPRLSDEAASDESEDVDFSEKQGFGRISSANGSQSNVDAPKRGLAYDQPWYSAIRKKGLENASTEELAKAAAHAADYVTPENMGVIKSLMAEVARRSRLGPAAKADIEAALERALQAKERTKDGAAKQASTEREEQPGDAALSGPDGQDPDGSEADYGSAYTGEEESGAQAGRQAAAPAVTTKKKRTIQRSAVETGGETLERSQTQATSRADVESDKVYGEAFKQLRAAGLGHMADWVSEWRTAGVGDDYANGWVEGTNRYTLTLKPSKNIKSAAEAQWTLRHETAHAADLVSAGGVYSAHPAMAFNENLEPTGEVAQEVSELVANDDFWGTVLEYPFAPEKFGLTEGEQQSAELFAELMALYTHPRGRLKLQADAPLTYKFIEAAANDIKQARPLAIRTPGEAKARRDAFAKRYSAISAQPAVVVRSPRSGDSGRIARSYAGLGSANADKVALKAAKSMEKGGDAFVTRNSQGPNFSVARSQGNSTRAAALEALEREHLTQPAGKIEQTVQKLPAIVRPVARAVARGAANLNRQLNKVIFTEDLLKRAADAGLRSAKAYKDLATQRATYVGEHERCVISVTEKYRDLPAKLQGKGPGTVNQYLYDSTTSRKWGYQPEWLDEDVEVDPETAKAYEALGADGQKFVDQVFKLGADTLAEKKRIVLDTTASEYDVLIRAAEVAGDDAKVEALKEEKGAALKKFGSLLRISGREPYSPLKRFGNYVVIAKSAEYVEAEQNGDTALMRELESDGDHYWVDFAETDGEADAQRTKLEATGKYAHSLYRERETARDELYGGSKTLQALMKLRARLDMTPEEDREVTSKLREKITDLYLMQLAEDSARKSEMARRNISGDIDMIRALETQGKADAAFLGGIAFAQSQMEAINAMRREMRASPPAKQTEQSGALNEIIKRHVQTFDYEPTPWANKLVRASSLWFLATSPSYYIQNATQPWVMSLPVMGARYEMGKAASALMKAYGDIAAAFKDAKVFSQLDFDKLLGDDYKALSKDERKMLRELLNNNRIDIGMATELGDARAGGDSKLANAWNKVDQGLRGLQLKMEALNRLTTAVAAFRLSMAESKDTAAATAYASDVLSQTHGDYSAWNAPRAFNTSLGKVALQFRKFQLIQLSLMAKLLKNSFSGASKEERAVARKALAYTMGQAMLLGGTLALPIPAALTWMFAKAFGDDADEPPEYVLRRMIGDKDIADLILKGGLGALGMDGRALVGWDKTFSILPFVDVDLTDRKSVAEAGFALLSGPFGGLALRSANALGYMQNGDLVRGGAMLLPKGITNIEKSVRTYADGVVNGRGETVLSPDEFTFWEAAQQALGFTPDRQVERIYRQNAAHDIEAAVKDQGADLRRDFAKAVRAGEPTGDIRRKWMEYQDRRVNLGFQRQPLSELMKAPETVSKNERNMAGGVKFNNDSEKFVKGLASM